MTGKWSNDFYLYPVSQVRLSIVCGDPMQLAIGLHSLGVNSRNVRYLEWA